MRAEAAGRRRDRLHRRGAARRDAGGAGGGRHRRRAVRRRRARAAVARVLLVAAEDLRIHGGRPAGRGAGDRSDSARSSRTAAKACSTIRPTRRRCADALAALTRTRRCASSSAPPRARARCATTAGRRTAARSTLRFRGDAAGRRSAMRILIADRRVSAGLRRQRLEHVRAGPRPARARARRRRSSGRARARRPACARRHYDGFRVVEFGAPAPEHAVRAQLLQERTADARRSRDYLCDAARARERYDIVHAQHVMTTIAGDRRGEARAACRSSPRCATTGPSATGRICMRTRDGLDAVPGVHRRRT